MQRLAAHAEAHADDAAVLRAIEAEARRRATPEGMAVAERVRELLQEQGAGQKALAPADLEERLRAANLALQELRTRLAETERQLSEARVARSKSADAYGRVYLQPDAPAWLVAAVRRAFRAHHHPDRFVDAQQKADAERRFKEAESVFARLLNQARAEEVRPAA
ncbi:MAG TPA: hypothetical protein VD970_01820 [Acetobacteraceae bacterium]|nr:hypothetical protein [Acetobacteraceae bacterium]